MQKYEIFSSKGVKLIAIEARSFDEARFLMTVKYPYLSIGYMVRR